MQVADVSKYEGRIRKAIRARFSGCDADTLEDLQQEGLLAACRRAEDCRGNYPQTYLVATALGEAMHYYRDRVGLFRAWRLQPEGDESFYDVEDAPAEQEDRTLLLACEQLCDLYAAKHPTRNWRIVLYGIAGGYTQQDMASALGVSQVTVTRYIRNLTTYLAAKLRRQEA